MEEKKILMTRKKLDGADLDKVTGGYIEHNNHLSSYQFEIVCPNCGEKRESFLNYSYDPDIPEFTDYRCRSCGREFRYEYDKTTNGVFVYYI